MLTLNAQDLAVQKHVAFRIQPIEGKGLGIVAANNLKPGQKVISVTARFPCHYHCDLTDTDTRL